MAGTSPAEVIFAGRIPQAAEMNDFNRQQMLAALVGLVTALFVMAQLPGRWRRHMRIAAIVLFILALGVALVEIGLWLAGPSP